MTPIPTPQNSKYIYTKQDEETHAQGGHTHSHTHAQNKQCQESGSHKYQINNHFMTIIHELNSMSLVQKHCFNKEMHTHTHTHKERKGRRKFKKGEEKGMEEGEWD